MLTVLILLMMITICLISLGGAEFDKRNGGVGVLLFFFGIAFFVLALWAGASIFPLKTPKPIEPDIIIKTVNGVSDTTYIYRR